MRGEQVAIILWQVDEMLCGRRLFRSGRAGEMRDGDTRDVSRGDLMPRTAKQARGQPMRPDHRLRGIRNTGPGPLPARLAARRRRMAAAARVLRRHDCRGLNPYAILPRMLVTSCVAMDTVDVKVCGDTPRRDESD